MNNRGDAWNGNWVATQWQNTAFRPVAWWSKAGLPPPEVQRSSANGRAQFWAPPRGYAVYVPQI